LFADLADFARPKVPMAPLTWFHIGGPADWLVEPRTDDELSIVLHRCHEAGMHVRLLGLGANLLVADGGVRGVVLRLAGPHLERINICNDRIEAGAGAHLTKLVRTAVNAGLAGLEVLAGIPGTVGGGIYMNCGGKFGDISGSVDSARVVNHR